MQIGLIVSLLMHAALLGWALFSIGNTAELEPPQETPIEVALITPSELLSLKKGSLSSTELEARQKETEKTEQSVKEADKPKPVTGEVAPPPAPEPPKPDPIEEKLAEPPPPVPAPPPAPSPEDQQKLAELAAKAEADRKAEEQRKAAEEKRKADERKRKEKERREREAKRKKELEEKNRKSLEQKMAELADKALLDKDPTKRGAANASDPSSSKTDYTGPTAGANQGDARELSATEAALLASQLRAQIRECWKLPGGGGGIETTVVTLTWRLRPDGSLDGEPKVINPRSDAIFQIAAEAALRAVKTCAPFDLPKDKYEFWKYIEQWDFNPMEML